MSKQQGKQGHWVQIKCPFFNGDTSTSIVCEGCHKYSSVRQTFANGAVKREWNERYCFGLKSYEQCPVYLMAMKKYEEV